MKRTLIGGAALAVAAVLAIYLGDALNLGLPNPLLGVTIGGALALAPGEHKLGRLVGFLVGIVVAFGGYGLSAAMLPASTGGLAVWAVVVIVLATAFAALSFGRMPLWSVLLGIAGFVGAYDWTYDDKPYAFLDSSFDTLGTFLVTFGFGYLAAVVADWLAPEEQAAESGEAEPTQELETVGSEG